MNKVHVIYKITNINTGWYYILKYTTIAPIYPPMYIYNRLPIFVRNKFPKETISIEEIDQFKFKICAFECRKRQIDLDDILCLNRKIGVIKGSKMKSGIKRKGSHKPKSEFHKKALSIAHKNSIKSQSNIQKVWPLSPMNKKGRSNPP